MHDHQDDEHIWEDVDFSKAMLDDPIVGVEVISDEQGPGARRARPLPVPKPMSPTEREIHDLTHLPMDLRCEICRLTRGLNAQHRATSEETRVIPLLVADYCFVKYNNSPALRTILVMRLYPYRLFFVCCVPRKGADPDVVRRIVRFIRDAGLTHFAYRCDREAAITSMIDEAASVLGRSCKKVSSDTDPADFEYPLAVVEDDEPDAPTEVPSPLDSGAPVVIVPELTHPGESASNGLAERSVGTLED